MILVWASLNLPCRNIAKKTGLDAAMIAEWAAILWPLMIIWTSPWDSVPNNLDKFFKRWLLYEISFLISDLGKLDNYLEVAAFLWIAGFELVDQIWRKHVLPIAPSKFPFAFE